MMNWIRIKSTFRNRRFVLFTLIFPLGTYWAMNNIAHSAGYNNFEFNTFAFVTAVIIGIAGNSVVTFSKKIADSLGFYRLQAQTSHYGFFSWLRDESLVNLFLNAVICLAVLLLALACGNVRLTSHLLLIITLLLILGLYLTGIGFFVAQVFDPKTISALAMPLSSGMGSLMIRWESFFNSNDTVIVILTAIQKFFPGYYLFLIIEKLNAQQSIAMELLAFIGTSLLLVIPFGLLFLSRKIKSA
ncbi:multidrug ABC transporter permease [Eupransor demetentiae]|uniref:ABC transporter n=1 Tax=Eupransor demetentiae TaxID=3109584 RepID=A0ABM9N353_9LACO|nr:hypothetical protein R54876_GBNLAHCA_00115 [Lactobacillaceae bacterium LMG 33000]